MISYPCSAYSDITYVNVIQELFKDIEELLDESKRGAGFLSKWGPIIGTFSLVVNFRSLWFFLGEELPDELAGLSSE